MSTSYDPGTAGPPGDAAPLLTLAELTARVGMSVRTIRFYTTRGLVPPPIRRGRSGYYSAEHVARLGLVAELQEHGFTLAAIERYLAGVPDDATPDELALQRAMLAPWTSADLTLLSTDELTARAGRELGEDDLATLAGLGIVTPTPDGRHRVGVSQLPVGLDLIDLGFPPEAAHAVAGVYAAHGRAIADELYDVFRRQVWPAYRDAGTPPALLQQVVERLKPLSVAGLVRAYEEGMDSTRRENIARRAGGYSPSMADKKHEDDPSLKDPDLYEELREQGNSPEKSARISNAKARSDAGDGPDPSKRGGAHPSYEEWTVDELRERAAELDIEGRSTMNKDDLVAALRDH